jgi:hypothetical protein
MLRIRTIYLLLATFYFLVFPVIIYAQPSQVPDANWTTVDHFKYCGSGECETFKNIQEHSIKHKFDYCWARYYGY